MPATISITPTTSIASWAEPGTRSFDPGGEVLLPVGHQVRELVEAEEDRRDGEGGAEQQERATRAEVAVDGGRGAVGAAVGCGAEPPTEGAIADDAARIGALADDTRRSLYEYVVTQREPVGREQAAGAVGVPLHTASFHLDKLVDAGLLETEFRRLTGRRGPGAGRPSKLYLRADREVAVSLPARRYDLAGDILAAAITRATWSIACRWCARNSWTVGFHVVCR
jgi:DNA-binding transcriptional ArsR family regulator